MRAQLYARQMIDAQACVRISMQLLVSPGFSVLIFMTPDTVYAYQGRLRKPAKLFMD
ncbi:uncharacterized protein FOMMEDRAFT_22240 [Fomitiporia mediterranea MF3/22]|uniref:uncharacterized protein n=1 Tax=Fomitiporia mediterranea (strain MF3/22) TaxID=694068 RepID=UPI00044080CC|nr:uncharacterized protein FOMMEDRAFT_22240 [Fomitiporia mediterranea MF3/22]EJD00433.1 hypothetical protein FOMMEDRAFT_22240 [Fomitiporia mediterranea MF3/22]